MRPLAMFGTRTHEHVTLTDGSRILIRPIAPSDEAALHAFHDALSPASVYRRFMAAYPHIPERVISYLASVDHMGHEALVAEYRGEIIGDARYVATGTDAEISFVVADAWQRRGVGRALTERLLRIARARGIRAITGVMLADNIAARRLLKAMFPLAEERIEHGELVFRARLRGDKITPGSSRAPRIPASARATG